MARVSESNEKCATEFATDMLEQALADTRHGVRMAWPVSPCYLWRGFVVADGLARGFYNPFRYYAPEGSTRQLEGYHSLYVRLARLANSADKELETFCSRYGLPDHPERTPPAELHPRSPYDRGDRSLLGRSETKLLYPVWYIRWLARYIAAWMRMAEAE